MNKEPNVEFDQVVSFLGYPTQYALQGIHIVEALA